MSAGLLDELTTPGTGEVWEPEELVIVATPSVSGVPSYLITRLDRQTDKMVVTAEGLRFWKATCREVKGTRQVIPAFAPVFPILRAQLASNEHRRAIAAAFWSFQDHPDRPRATYLAAVVADYLATDPD